MYMSTMNQPIFFYIYFVQYGGLLICTLYLHYKRELYRDCSFRFDPLTNMAILVLDWSISKNLLLWNCFAKTNRNLVGSTCSSIGYERFCIKFPQSRMASYQVSVHLPQGFQRRRLKCEKLTDDWWQTTNAKWWKKLTLPLFRFDPLTNMSATGNSCFRLVAF
jgi:hypothetical protein